MGDRRAAHDDLGVGNLSWGNPAMTETSVACLPERRVTRRVAQDLRVSVTEQDLASDSSIERES